MKTRLRLLVILFTLGVTLSSLRAHETWLAPSGDAVAPDAPVDLSLTSGMKFPLLEYAIKPERVELARYRLGATEGALAAPSRGEFALRFRESFPPQGWRWGG